MSPLIIKQATLTHATLSGRLVLRAVVQLMPCHVSILDDVAI